MRIIGSHGRQGGLFTRPRAVVVSPAEEVYAIDRSGRVQVFGLESGEYRRQWQLPAWQNGTPTGACWDPTANTLLVADTHYQRILEYDSNGTLVHQFGEHGTGPGQFVFPTDVAVDPKDQSLWVTEFGIRNRLMRFDRTGRFLAEWGWDPSDSEELLRPQAVVISPAGEVIVADAGNHRLNVYSREGVLLRRMGVAGRNPGEFNYPYDLALSPEGDLFVVEYGNSRVSHYDASGRFLGWWGSPGIEPGGLYNPWGIALGPRGQIVVSDTNSHRLQVIDRPARVFRGNT